VIFSQYSVIVVQLKCCRHIKKVLSGSKINRVKTHRGCYQVVHLWFIAAKLQS